MKKLLLIVLIVACLVGIAVPLYAQDELTLEGIADKVEAIIEILTSMSDRLTAYEERLAILEATDTPTPTPTASPTATPTSTASPTPTATPTPDSATVTMCSNLNEQREAKRRRNRREEGG